MEMDRLAVGGWAWVALAITLALSLAIDLFAHRHGTGDETRLRAALWSVGWVAMATVFGTGVALALGGQAGAEFATAYLIEKSLSVDNLCVFLLIFAGLRIPRSEQRRVLFWGILGALIARGAFIAGGAALVARWHVILYGFGMLLVVTGARLLATAPSVNEPHAVRWLRRHLPIAHDAPGGRFFAVEAGKWRATHLVLALVAIEITDILFAIDSIPAIFSVTRTPFILYASNVLAVLGLRALFIVVADALELFRHLRFGVAGVLVFSGAKMLTTRWVHLSAGTSLVVITLLLATATGASLLPTRGARRT